MGYSSVEFYVPKNGNIVKYLLIPNLDMLTKMLPKTNGTSDRLVYILIQKNDIQFGDLLISLTVSLLNRMNNNIAETVKPARSPNHIPMLCSSVFNPR